MALLQGVHTVTWFRSGSRRLLALAVIIVTAVVAPVFAMSGTADAHEFDYSGLPRS